MPHHETYRRKHLIILTIGTLWLSLPLILKHYFIVPDFQVGLMKGIGIGLMLVSLIKVSKDQRNLMNGA